MGGNGKYFFVCVKLDISVTHYVNVLRDEISRFDDSFRGDELLGKIAAK